MGGVRALSAASGAAAAGGGEDAAAVAATTEEESAPPGPSVRVNISLGRSTLETAKTATGFWSKTVRVMVACTTPVSMATEPLARVMLRVKRPALLNSVASVG